MEDEIDKVFDVMRQAMYKALVELGDDVKNLDLFSDDIESFDTEP